MKWYGKIGFSVTRETPPNSGIWVDDITERNYYGDFSRLSKRWATASQVNDNLEINHELSIIADPFANEHYQSIKYIQYGKVLWKVDSVEVQHPRLYLKIGGVYNG